MLNQTLKNVSFYVGALLIFLAGLLYVLLTDVYLKNQAAWLFISILLSFGSGICLIVGEMFKEKQWLTYLLKGIAIALAIGFIVFLCVFRVSDFFTGLKVQLTTIKNVAVIVSLVLTSIAVVVQTINIVFNKLFIEE